MHTKRMTVSLWALAFGLAVAGFAGAASEAPAAQKDAPKSCCHHEGGTDGSAGAHCAHPRAGAKSGDEKACCSKPAGAKKEGAKAGCCCCEDCAAAEAKETAAGS